MTALIVDTVANPEAASSDWDRALKSLTERLFDWHTGEKTTAEVCAPLLEAAIQTQRSPLAQVWSVDPRNRQLILIAEALAQPELLLHGIERPVVLDTKTTFLGEVVQSRQVMEFSDLTMVRDGRRFEFPELAQRLAVRSLIVVPIRNVGNPHQVLAVLSIGLAHPPRNKIPTEDLMKLAKLLATVIESHLRERTFRFATSLAADLSRIEALTGQVAYGRFAELLKDAVQADWVSVYIQNWDRHVLKRRAEVGEQIGSTNDDDPPPIPFVVDQVWKFNREQLSSRDLPTLTTREIFEQSVSPAPWSTMLVPIRDLQGTAVGVVRCVKREPTSGRPFSYDEVAIADALGQAFGPPLQTLLAAEQREVALSRLCHEIRVPLTALCAAAERMEWEYKQTDFRFDHPYFIEFDIFLNLMNRLFIELEIVRKGADALPLDFRPTNFANDVLRPAKRFLVTNLRRYGLKSSGIIFHGFDAWPFLKLDTAMISQIVFNLLDNAAKFYQGPPREFCCEIFAEKTSDQFHVVFRDNGPGIAPEHHEGIFQYGKRGIGIEQQTRIKGSGLGLWISREIARRHDGTLTLRSAKPGKTEFVLSLPKP